MSSKAPTHQPRSPVMGELFTHPKAILFGPRGRIGRASFVLGVVILVVLALSANALLRWLDSDTLVHFLFGFAFYLTFIYMVTSVFVQRLHDLGRSAWVYTAWICLIVLTLIGVMLAFGGTEYFNTFAQFDRKEAIDPEITTALIEEYELELAKAGPTLNLILYVLIGGFAALLALLPGKGTANRYGPAPTHAPVVAA